MTRPHVVALSLIAGSFISHTLAGTPQGWRGDATGRFPDATPPIHWSHEENVVWKTEMPGRSYGSPVVVGDRIFVVSDPAELLCIAATDGEILWRRTISPADALGAEAAKELLEEWTALEEQKKQLRNEYRDLRRTKPDAKDEQEALKEKLKLVDEQVKQLKQTRPVPNKGGSGNSAATPVCDGTHVYAAFGDGMVAAFDMQGEKKWVKFVEGATIGFGHSSSPVLVNGKLIVHFNDLVALDTSDGKIVWRTELPARHATGLPVTIGEVDAVISPSGSIVRASDGKVLTSEQALRVSEGSQIIHDGVIYAQAGKTSAFRLPTVSGDQVALELLWETRASRGRRTPSSVIHDNLLYGVTTNGILEVNDAKTGKIVFRNRLDVGNIYSSVTSAGEHVFITNTKGETIVLAGGREYKEVARNNLEPLGSNPVFVGRRMYVRGHKHLYCIGR